MTTLSVVASREYYPLPRLEMDICWSNVNQVSPPREVIMRIGLIVIEKNTNLAVKCFNSLHDSGFQGRNTVKMFPSYTGSGAACFAIVG